VLLDWNVEVLHTLIIELQCNFISASGTKYSIWTHGNIHLGKRDVPVSGIIWTGPYSLAVYLCTIYFVPLHGLGFHEIPSVKILTLSLSYSSFNTNLHIETNGINFKRIIRANKILFLWHFWVKWALLLS
jgi:hypothetical protein